MRITSDDLLDIMVEASNRLNREIREAFKRGNLEGYLDSIGMRDLFPVPEEPIFQTDPEGKILVIGEARIKEQQIYGCFKEFGITKDRVVLKTRYYEAKTFSFKDLQYNPNYRLILFGPVPHSVEGKGDSSSIIAQMENSDGYPKVVRLSDGHGLKLTKTSLKRAIAREIDSGYLVV